MADLQRIKAAWGPCIVAAPGPSLPAAVRAVRVARLTRGWKVLAVQDAYRLLPYADALYGCNPSWWRRHRDCDGFTGEKWTTHEAGEHLNDKIGTDPKVGRPLADAFGLNVVAGKAGDTFSTDPGVIHYGSNSGFQAINLAILKGSRQIVLVGFDMRHVDGKSHFFGKHDFAGKHVEDQDYGRFVKYFERAARVLPDDVSIVNATPGSALRCFPMVDLEEALNGERAPAAYTACA